MYSKWKKCEGGITLPLHLCSTKPALTQKPRKKSDLIKGQTLKTLTGGRVVLGLRATAKGAIIMQVMAVILTSVGCQMLVLNVVHQN